MTLWTFRRLISLKNNLHLFRLRLHVRALRIARGLNDEAVIPLSAVWSLCMFLTVVSLIILKIAGVI